MSDTATANIYGEFQMNSPKTIFDGIAAPKSIVITKDDDGSIWYRIDKFDALIPENHLSPFIDLPTKSISDSYSPTYGNMTLHSRLAAKITDVKHIANAITCQLVFMMTYSYTGTNMGKRSKDSVQEETFSVTATKS
jgi:hypothetical protein